MRRSAEKVARNRELRRVALTGLRHVWYRVDNDTRARWLRWLARQWTYHPAAIAVERSAEARIRNHRSKRGLP